MTICFLNLGSDLSRFIVRELGTKCYRVIVHVSGTVFAIVIQL